MLYIGNQSLRQTVEDESGDAVRCLILQKSEHHSADRRLHAFTIYHDDHRRFRLFREIVCRTGISVIKAHNALNYGNISRFAVPVKQIAECIPVTEIAVEIAGRCAENLAVKHRINIIRTAFE